jgi:hypothetical protein
MEPEWNHSENVVGCGIFLSSEKKLSLFFTLNGILMGQSTPCSVVLCENPGFGFGTGKIPGFFYLPLLIPVPEF